MLVIIIMEYSVRIMLYIYIPFFSHFYDNQYDPISWFNIYIYVSVCLCVSHDYSIPLFSHYVSHYSPTLMVNISWENHGRILIRYMILSHYICPTLMVNDHIWSHLSLTWSLATRLPHVWRQYRPRTETQGVSGKDMNKMEEKSLNS